MSSLFFGLIICFFSWFSCVFNPPADSFVPEKISSAIQIHDTVWHANEDLSKLSGFQSFVQGSEIIVCLSYLGQLYFMDQSNGNVNIFSAIPEGKWVNKSLGRIIGIYAHNFDSIFILQEEALSLVDTNGVKELYSLSDITINRQRYTASYLQNSPPVFDSKAGRIYFPVYCYNCSPFQKSYFNNPVEAYFDLATRKIQFLPVSYPDNYSNYYYGFMDHVSFAWNETKAVFSFNASPDIFVYDFEVDSTLIFGGKSTFQTKSIPPLSRKKRKDVQAKADHMKFSEIYFGVIYDPYRRLFYRIFFEELEIKNADGTYNDFEDRSYILMVFDEHFQLHTEIQLSDCHGFGWFVTPKGLFLPVNNDINPQKNAFKLIAVDEL